MTGSEYAIGAGSPEPLGLVCDAAGANVAVFSAHASAIDLCLFSADGSRETARLSLPERTGDVWHGRVEGLRSGQLYGLRAHGEFAPEAGQRFNPAKLLLDPYATMLSGPVSWSPALNGHSADDPALPDATDSAPHMPKCIAATPLPPIDPAERPRTPWADTVIYEAHPKGLTQLWPDLNPATRGRLPALADPAVIAHLTGLGVSAVELLPVHAFTDERHLAAHGLSNYWGYNSVAFFAPDPRYLGETGLAGLRETVRRLHEAGLEVILDVVYNHSGEGDADGPTIAFRGLDNLSYYHRDPDAPGGYANHTGCGNTLDLSHPFVLRLVLDSMRWWAAHIGIDGFRFDLAPVLTRNADGFDPGSAFLDALLQDPVLRKLKLIAEPWDIGPDGYQPGAFPAPLAEWNDRFRDSVRGFWRGDDGAPADLADGLLGSARIFDHGGRRAWTSVNFVACHDGFTLADLTLYDRKHNEANLEDNRDGHGDNLSDNFGVEGPSDDADIVALRDRRRRNLIATALLAQGTPMIRAGDEIAQSQGGNNNAYCQDNETNWINWASGDRNLCDFVCRVLTLRRLLPVMRQAHFLHGQPVPGSELADVEWLALDGSPLDWEDGADAGYALLQRGADMASALLVLNRGGTSHELALPLPEAGQDWWRLLDTAQPGLDPHREQGAADIGPDSIVLLSDSADAVKAAAS